MDSALSAGISALTNLAELGATNPHYQQFLQTVALEISENGWSKSSAPEAIKYWLASDVMSTLPMELVKKIFKMYIQNKKNLSSILHQVDDNMQNGAQNGMPKLQDSGVSGMQIEEDSEKMDISENRDPIELSNSMEEVKTPVKSEAKDESLGISGNCGNFSVSSFVQKPMTSSPVVQNPAQNPANNSQNSTVAQNIASQLSTLLNSGEISSNVIEELKQQQFLQQQQAAVNMLQQSSPQNLIQQQAIQIYQNMQNGQNVQSDQNAQNVQNSQNLQKLQNFMQNGQNLNVQNLQNVQNGYTQQTVPNPQNIQNLNLQSLQNLQNLQKLHNFQNNMSNLQNNNSINDTSKPQYSMTTSPNNAQTIINTAQNLQNIPKNQILDQTPVSEHSSIQNASLHNFSPVNLNNSMIGNTLGNTISNNLGNTLGNTLQNTLQNNLHNTLKNNLQNNLPQHSQLPTLTNHSPNSSNSTNGGTNGGFQASSSNSPSSAKERDAINQAIAMANSKEVNNPATPVPENVNGGPVPLDDEVLENINLSNMIEHQNDYVLLLEEDDHTRKREFIIKCLRCKKYTTRQHERTKAMKNFRNHLQRSCIRDMICPVCQQHVTKQKFEKHLYLKHNIRIKEEMYECDACSRNFLSQRSLRLHQLQTHNPNNRSGSPKNNSENLNTTVGDKSIGNIVVNNGASVGSADIVPSSMNAATQLILDKIKQENEIADSCSTTPVKLEPNSTNLSSEQRLQLEIQKYVNKHNGESSVSGNNSSVLPSLLNM